MPNPINQRPLVLIIDSEEAVRDLYGDWFTSLGFQVMCAVGTLAAVEILQNTQDEMAALVGSVGAQDA